MSRRSSHPSTTTASPSGPAAPRSSPSSEGTPAVGRLRADPKDPNTKYGADVTVHYRPGNLDAFTLDPADGRGCGAREIAFVALCVLLGVAGAVAGALLL
ncbi:hypothetical protein [Streptomyces niveus]|uniref:hypothetical protein n=1 Tax=Streptomyces niveus TaxID=193462 RepID=UPI003436C3CA